MPVTIITKNSNVASNVPLANELVQGELAVNTTDRKIFTKDETDTVVEVGGGAGGGEVNTASTPSVSGSGLTMAKVGEDLPFKSIIGGTGVTISEQSDSITLTADAATGGVPDGTSIYQTLRWDGSSDWVVNSFERLRDDSVSFGNTSANGFKMAVSTGTNTPSSGVTSEVPNLALVASGDAGMAIISGSADNASIYFGDSSVINGGSIRYDNSVNELQIWHGNSTMQRVTVEGMTFSNYAPNGGRCNWEKAGSTAFGAASYVTSGGSFITVCEDADIQFFTGGTAGVGSLFLETDGDVRVINLSAGAVYATASGVLTNTPTAAVLAREALLDDLAARVTALENP